jgi:hypothetical protein
MCVRMTSDRLALVGAFAILLSVCATAPIAHAQQLPTNPPLPPPRPAFSDDEPRAKPNVARSEDAASQVTPRSGEAHVAPSPTKPLAGWTWPPTDRQAMRACALEWQKLKDTGASGVTTWREFAPDCLTRQTPPHK